MAALRQTPITFRPFSPPSAKIIVSPTATLSFSGGLRLPKFTIKPTSAGRLSRRRGAVVAQMADSAAPSYASALCEVAKSNGTLEQTSADLTKIEEIFADDSVLDFFSSPVMSDETKLSLIDEIAESAGFQTHTANFLKVLVEMERMELIREILKEFETAYDRLTETELAVVTSVVKLESQHLAQIAKGVQRLTGAKNVRIKTAIDPSLVAGFTIRFGNSGSKMIDMSVKKQLQDVAAQIEMGDIQLAI
ncbi:unnamed protein product [Cuscuta campestris]|uniref:ATP synthase delta chain, chloroplastic n=1 Tax=Cuscuta campestris TaxID=132261 RepID=A0A484MCZ6_9ASTE|nr:unnamed protein product [Cuscuta campestris]